MITEIELIKRVETYVKNCGGEQLVDLYNHVYGDGDITMDDVDWSNSEN